MPSSEHPEFLVRTLRHADFEGLLALYTHLHDDDPPSLPAPLLFDLWTRIVQDPAQTYVGAFVNGMLCSVANVSFIPNLTRSGRPFAVIENVVTHPSHRRLGLASSVVTRILELCQQHGCYKVMLLSSASREGAHSFYRSLGFDGDSKRAFIRRYKA